MGQSVRSVLGNQTYEATYDLFALWVEYLHVLTWPLVHAQLTSRHTLTHYRLLYRVVLSGCVDREL